LLISLEDDDGREKSCELRGRERRESERRSDSGGTRDLQRAGKWNRTFRTHIMRRNLTHLHSLASHFQILMSFLGELGPVALFWGLDIYSQKEKLKIKNAKILCFFEIFNSRKTTNI
jgi:hypothetical protein